MPLLRGSWYPENVLPVILELGGVENARTVCVVDSEGTSHGRFSGAEILVSGKNIVAGAIVRSARKYCNTLQRTYMCLTIPI